MNLNFDQLVRLIDVVFAPTPDEKDLALFVDLPDEELPDNEAWRDRRQIAFEWFRTLKSGRTPFKDVTLYCYRNVGSNNNDLPDVVNLLDADAPSLSPEKTRPCSLGEVLLSSSVVMAMTELSATAPLKMLARKHNFRGATLPGFMRTMIPALGLDYEKVNARVMEFKRRLDDAQYASVRFLASATHYELLLDLRHREAHASGGIMREPGTVANLPSGEAYIVPYEGEKPNDPSKTRGLLPVQFADEVVVYEVDANRAFRVISSGDQSRAEQQKLSDEPAYGNLAELGIGVLGEWGVTAVGSTLLDEKLGLHIAFGRSEHFGGVTSPASFKSPKNVVHIDRVFVPSCQPLIAVEELSLLYAGAATEIVLRDGKYLI